MEEIKNNTQAKMDKVIEMVKRDFASVRTGRATPSLVDSLEIEAYEGTPAMRMLELATISVPDAKTIVITPFDPSIIEKIEKGIRGHDLGLNPSVDEKVIRISVPPLTEERRRDYVKLINEKAESGKVMVRQARHEGMEAVKEAGAGMSEDDVRRAEDEIQKMTDVMNDEIDSIREAKEKELMQL